MSLSAVKDIGRAVVDTCVNSGAKIAIAASNVVDHIIASRPIHRLKVSRRHLKHRLFGLTPPRPHTIYMLRLFKNYPRETTFAVLGITRLALRL